MIRSNIVIVMNTTFGIVLSVVFVAQGGKGCGVSISSVECKAAVEVSAIVEVIVVGRFRIIVPEFVNEVVWVLQLLLVVVVAVAAEVPNSFT
jgi:hypothetical protein